MAERLRKRRRLPEPNVEKEASAFHARSEGRVGQWVPDAITVRRWVGSPFGVVLVEQRDSGRVALYSFQERVVQGELQPRRYRRLTPEGDVTASRLFESNTSDELVALGLSMREVGQILRLSPSGTRRLARAS